MTVATGPRSYSLVLPPGWQRLCLGPRAEAEVRALLDAAFEGVPRDRAAPFRGELKKSLLLQVTRAREQHGLDLYLPVLGGEGLLLVSFCTLVTETPAGPDGTPEPRLSDALVDLFDAIMTTLRWRHA